MEGYVDHQAMQPVPGFFRHFNEQEHDRVGRVYRRHTYEILLYWDEERLD